MFVGCFEISTSIIDKHIQNIGTIRAFCLPGGPVKIFITLRGRGGTEEIAGLWFARGISTQADTMDIRNIQTTGNSFGDTLTHATWH